MKEEQRGKDEQQASWVRRFHHRDKPWGCCDVDKPPANIDCKLKTRHEEEGKEESVGEAIEYQRHRDESNQSSPSG